MSRETSAIQAELENTQAKLRNALSLYESEQIEVDISNGLLHRISEVVESDKPFQEMVRQVREIIAARPKPSNP